MALNLDDHKNLFLGVSANNLILVNLGSLKLTTLVN